MNPLPSWLDVKPTDYLKASEAGDAAGARLSGLKTEVTLAQNRGIEAKTAQAAQLAHDSAMQSQRIAAAQQQNQAQMEQAQMEFQAKQEVQQRQAIKEQQQTAVENAYKEQGLGLRQTELNRVGAESQLKAAQAAALFAEHKGFADDVASGKFTPEQAIYRHPKLMSTGVMGNLTQRPPADPTQIETVTSKETFPAVPGSAAVPASKHWFGPDTPAQPEVPASPARTVDTTRKVRKGEGSSIQPDKKHVDYLLAHPDTADQFDAFFKQKGLAASILSQQDKTLSDQPVPAMDGRLPSMFGQPASVGPIPTAPQE